MGSPLQEFGATAQKLARNPIGIIALFIVLVYGIAALVLGASGTILDPSQKSILVWFLVIFPCLVLAAFLWLVSSHHTKLYAPSDFHDDAGFLRTLTIYEQKAKLEEEAREALEEVSTTSNHQALQANQHIELKTTDVKKSILLAEDLVLRELETEFKTSINRNVAIGSHFELDGMFAKGGEGYGIEVKYLNYSTSPKAIQNVINKFSNMAAISQWKRFHLILAFVVHGGNNLNRKETLNEAIYEYVTQSKLDIDLRFYDLGSLQRKYGVD